MGLFSRKNNSDSQTNSEIAERGRDYAIAKRHGDRRAMNNIMRQMGSGDLSEADREAFRAGQESYDSLPPVPSSLRRRKR